MGLSACRGLKADIPFGLVTFFFIYKSWVKTAIKQKSS